MTKPNGWEEIKKRITFILTVKPTYIKPRLSKKSIDQLRLVHQQSELEELFSQAILSAEERVRAEAIKHLRRMTVWGMGEKTDKLINLYLKKSFEENKKSLERMSLSLPDQDQLSNSKTNDQSK